MTSQLSTSARNAALDAAITAIGANPILKLRSGEPPANCAGADTGTVLATIAMPTPAFSAAAGGTKSLTGTWQDTSADASGDPGHYRIYASDGVTCHHQGHASVPWVASRAYSAGAKVHNGGNVYRCTGAGTAAGSGGPSGTGGSIADGTAIWAFVQAGTDMAFDAGPITAAQQVNVTALTLTAGGA